MGYGNIQRMSEDQAAKWIDFELRCRMKVDYNLWKKLGYEYINDIEE